MTLHSKSREEARQLNFLKSRFPIKFGTWNILRTMFEAGRCATIAKEIKLLGLFETRWTQSGQMRVNIQSFIDKSLREILRIQ